MIVKFSIDIGMVVKLRKTLNEMLEKSKQYISKEQQEKKRIESETLFKNARSMVFLNISLNVFFKLPAFLYMINYLNIEDKLYTYMFRKLYKFSTDFQDFLYFLYISIQFFFYFHFDKKITSFKKVD